MEMENFEQKQMKKKKKLQWKPYMQDQSKKIDA